MVVLMNGKSIVTCPECGHQAYEDTGMHVSDYILTRQCRAGKQLKYDQHLPLTVGASHILTNRY